MVANFVALNGAPPRQPLAPLSCLFPVFTGIFVYCTLSCRFPWLLAFVWLYLSFVAVGRGSLFLCSRVGDRHEFL